MIKLKRDPIVIFGVKRGGIHAITYWIMEHCDSEHLNCEEIHSSNVSTITKKELLVMGHENQDLRKIKNTEGISCPVDYSKFTNVLVMRDAYNWYASALKINTNSVFNDVNDHFGVWKQYALEALGETNYMPNKVLINYNSWFVSKSYREEKSNELGFEHTDKGLNLVGPAGGGSSFDMQKYHGKAQEMDVLNRWAYALKHMPKFAAIFEDEEIIDLNKRLFGINYLVV